MRDTRARGSSSSSIAIRPEVRVHIVPVSSSSAMSGYKASVVYVQVAVSQYCGLAGIGLVSGMSV